MLEALEITSLKPLCNIAEDIPDSPGLDIIYEKNEFWGGIMIRNFSE